MLLLVRLLRDTVSGVRITAFSLIHDMPTPEKEALFGMKQVVAQAKRYMGMPLKTPDAAVLVHCRHSGSGVIYACALLQVTVKTWGEDVHRTVASKQYMRRLMLANGFEHYWRDWYPYMLQGDFRRDDAASPSSEMFGYILSTCIWLMREMIKVNSCHDDDLGAVGSMMKTLCPREYRKRALVQIKNAATSYEELLPDCYLSSSDWRVVTAGFPDVMAEGDWKSQVQPCCMCHVHH